jgi:hypothetical protein
MSAINKPKVRQPHEPHVIMFLLISSHLANEPALLPQFVHTVVRGGSHIWHFGHLTGGSVGPALAAAPTFVNRAPQPEQNREPEALSALQSEHTTIDRSVSLAVRQVNSQRPCRVTKPTEHDAVIRFANSKRAKIESALELVTAPNAASCNLAEQRNVRVRDASV